MTLALSRSGLFEFLAATGGGKDSFRSALISECMEPLLYEIIEHIREHLVAFGAVVLLAGFRACRTVAYD